MNAPSNTGGDLDFDGNRSCEQANVPDESVGTDSVDALSSGYLTAELNEIESELGIVSIRRNRPR